MKEITLTLDLVNALMNYIGTRPYAEVHQLIAEVQRQAAGQLEQEQVNTEPDVE
jgi:hypothetical protein